MRAIFRELSPTLKDGSYVFVAKVGLFDTPHENLLKDFKKVLKNAKTIT
jgi:ribonuclease P protein component